MTFYCDVHDQTTRFTGTLEFDGYSIGDSLLEGVFFLADIIDGELQEKSVRVRRDCAAYFENLNTEKWLAAALVGIKTYDIYALHSTNQQVEDQGGDELWRTDE